MQQIAESQEPEKPVVNDRPCKLENSSSWSYTIIASQSLRAYVAYQRIVKGSQRTYSDPFLIGELSKTNGTLILDFYNPIESAEEAHEPVILHFLFIFRAYTKPSRSGMVLSRLYMATLGWHEIVIAMQRHDELFEE